MMTAERVAATRMSAAGMSAAKVASAAMAMLAEVRSLGHRLVEAFRHLRRLAAEGRVGAAPAAEQMEPATPLRFELRLSKPAARLRETPPGIGEPAAGFSEPTAKRRFTKSALRNGRRPVDGRGA